MVGKSTLLSNQLGGMVFQKILQEVPLAEYPTARRHWFQQFGRRFQQLNRHKWEINKNDTEKLTPWGSYPNFEFESAQHEFFSKA